MCSGTGIKELEELPPCTWRSKGKEPVGILSQGLWSRQSAAGARGESQEAVTANIGPGREGLQE